MYNIGSAFHTACLLLHFPPLLSALAFSVAPAFISDGYSTSTAESIGADHLSAQKIRPRHHVTLHWLRIHRRVVYKLCTIVYDTTLSYLMEIFQPVSNVSGRSCLRSSVIWLYREPKRRLTDLAVLQRRGQQVRTRYLNRSVTKTSLFRSTYRCDLIAHS